MDVHQVDVSATPSIQFASPQVVAKQPLPGESDRGRNVYLATVAHEMRNALGPLSCAIDVMALRADDVEAHADMLPIARRQLAQLVTLTDDLLDFGRALNGEFQMDFSVEPLQPLVNNVVSAWRPLADLKGNTISLDAPDSQLLVRMDHMRLSQALQNVIGNAVKYTPERGHIAVRVHAIGEEVVIAITDSGIGIPPADMANIFGLFFRARAQGSSPRGFGIGLALARRLVESHGGRISASSAGAGQGSSFAIALPIAVLTHDA
jgi:signal transduction histidine kinase